MLVGSSDSSIVGELLRTSSQAHHCKAQGKCGRWAGQEAAEEFVCLLLGDDAMGKGVQEHIFIFGFYQTPAIPQTDAFINVHSSLWHPKEREAVFNVLCFCRLVCLLLVF